MPPGLFRPPGVRAPEPLRLLEFLRCCGWDWDWGPEPDLGGRRPLRFLPRPRGPEGFSGAIIMRFFSLCFSACAFQLCACFSRVASPGVGFRACAAGAAQMRNLPRRLEIPCLNFSVCVRSKIASIASRGRSTASEGAISFGNYLHTTLPRGSVQAEPQTMGAAAVTAEFGRGSLRLLRGTPFFGAKV